MREDSSGSRVWNKHVYCRKDETSGSPGEEWLAVLLGELTQAVQHYQGVTQELAGHNINDYLAQRSGAAVQWVGPQVRTLLQDAVGINEKLTEHQVHFAAVAQLLQPRCQGQIAMRQLSQLFLIHGVF